MVVAGRRKSVAFFIALGAGLISVILLLYVGWVLLGWRHGILLSLGVLLSMFLIGGVVLNTVYLVREIRRNEHQDAFINAVMLDDNDRLLDTIEQILRTGRIGAGIRRPNLSRIDLGGVVAECVDRARALHQVPEEALKFHAGSPVPILADLDEVRAAVSNLIDNAVKYSGKDVQVTVEIGMIDQHDVALRVQDRGPGIPKTELKQIFKRFHRVPGPAGKRVPGTGLGLYIVRSVAKRHGGRAWAESEGPGRGSTFVLQLPIAR